MKILVTGSSGFIGRQLIRTLRDVPGTGTVVGVSRDNQKFSWEAWSAVDGQGIWLHLEESVDISDGNRVRLLMEQHRPDVIFHLAANPLVRLSGDDPRGTESVRTNVIGTQNLLAHAPHGCRFVLASSAAVYGDNCLTCYELNKLQPNSVYAASKIAAEGLVIAQDRLGNVRGLILRYVANVGPGATHGIVRDFIAKLRSDRTELHVLGDEPGSVKPFMHAEDTASATVALGLSDKGGVWNISPGGSDSLSVLEVAETVMEGLGVTKPIVWLGEAANWKGDQRVLWVSNFRLREETDWRPRFETSREAVLYAAQQAGALYA